ncbi:alpha/beta hydrolase [Actinomycetospora straminea]|uniref:Alpha/beta hydrolase n=1 Tax=Actinomycetospora straminea TaxID=663607 RepID=A0ABP9F4P7_9PSEU|nr:alpha/beta hydrolase [Actinomycetospora straminea]MDD7933656.1 alpha/beta hydrolase [Actinomycetospora straminea]
MPQTTDRQPTLLLVHGAWHGSWFWDPLRAELDGFDVRTVDPSSCRNDPEALGDLHADAETVRAALEAIDGPVVVVAHSYGGQPVSEAAGSTVVHIVYLCSFLLDAGESLLGAVGGTPPPWWEVHETHIVARTPEEVFYNDLDEATATAAAGRLGLLSRAATEQPLTRAAWHDVPTTYVVCDRDAAIPPFAQEAMAGRAGTVVHVDAGHSAAVSQPAEVAAIVRRAAGS